MRQELMSSREGAERTVRDIRRKTRKQYSAEEKIRIVVSGLRGEDSIEELCRRKGLPRACITAGRRSSSRLARSGFRGDTAHQASSGEVKELRHEMRDLKEASQPSRESAVGRVVGVGWPRRQPVDVGRLPTAASAAALQNISVRTYGLQPSCMLQGCGSETE